MKLGFSSYTRSWAVGVSGYPAPAVPLSALGLLEQAAGYGLHVLQIADNLPLHTLSMGERAELRDDAERLGTVIEVGTRGIAPAHLGAYLDIAAFFRSPILRVVIDTATHHPSPDEVVAILRPQLARFAAAGVTLAIENHDRFRARTLADIVQTLGGEAAYIGICLDTVNSFGALEGSNIVVPTLAPYVVNLHVKDFAIRRVPHQMGLEVTGMPAGEGTLDVPGLLAALEPRRQARDFNAILEFWMAPVSDRCGVVDMAATIEQEAGWTAQSIAYLRTLIRE